tara:strand:- start:45 stop:392 length:348 start_codon:yes stop_codon:yes gene_type:complete
MNIKGKITLKNETVQITDTFKKRDFVVLTDEKYPQKIIIELTQDKCQLLDEFNEGDFVDVKINIRGREWKSPEGNLRYFNSIHAWDIIKIIDEEKKEDFEPVTKNWIQKEDDLPF